MFDNVKMLIKTQYFTYPPKKNPKSQNGRKSAGFKAKWVFCLRTTNISFCFLFIEDYQL